jgi:glycosyltransferase involved in cell wall biosynthesis
MTTTAATSASPVAPAAKTRDGSIAVMLSRFPTVTETFILREVLELERQGQPVRLVPMIRENPKIVHDAARPWIERALFTPFLSLSIAGANVLALLRHPFRYTTLLVRLVAGTITRPKSLLRTLALFPKAVFLGRQLRKEGIRHLHVHFASHPTTMAMIASKFSNIPFSFTVHAHDIQVDRSLLRWKLREARFVRSISDYNRRFLEGLYPKEATGKIDVVHVGIEPHVYDENVRRHASATPDPTAVPKILCVAAHKPYKGIKYLIEACRILRDEGIEFECNQLGHGPMYDELQQMIRERNLEDRVHLLGPRPEAEVARMMAEATIFALPSIVEPNGKMEGIPVALMEAMASGRAVVSTTTAGIPELVENGVSGLLVPPGDARALADAMRTLLTNPERARELGARGREKVQREFDLRLCVTQLLDRLDREIDRKADRETVGTSS